MDAQIAGIEKAAKNMGRALARAEVTKKQQEAGILVD